MHDRERNINCNLRCKETTMNNEAIDLPFMKNEVKVLIYLKMTLTIKEAAEYSNIGINKIEKEPKCPFVLYVGAKKLVKRKEFEDYISKKISIITYKFCRIALKN